MKNAKRITEKELQFLYNFSKCFSDEKLSGHPEEFESYYNGMVKKPDKISSKEFLKYIETLSTEDRIFIYKADKNNSIRVTLIPISRTRQIPSGLWQIRARYISELNFWIEWDDPADWYFKEATIAKKKVKIRWWK